MSLSLSLSLLSSLLSSLLLKIVCYYYKNEIILDTPFVGPKNDSEEPF